MLLDSLFIIPAVRLMLGKDRSLKAVDHYSEVKQDGHNMGQDKRKEYKKEQKGGPMPFYQASDFSKAYSSSGTKWTV